MHVSTFATCFLSPCNKPRETTTLRIDKVKGCMFVNQYLVLKFLGRGACGKVFLCLNTRDLHLYAMKVRACMGARPQRVGRNAGMALAGGNIIGSVRVRHRGRCLGYARHSRHWTLCCVPGSVRVTIARACVGYESCPEVLCLLSDARECGQHIGTGGRSHSSIVILLNCVLMTTAFLQHPLCASSVPRLDQTLCPSHCLHHDTPWLCPSPCLHHRTRCACLPPPSHA